MNNDNSNTNEQSNDVARYIAPGTVPNGGLNTGPRFQSFRVHRNLVQRDTLKTLSHDALKVYLFAAHRMYANHSDRILLSDLSLGYATGLEPEQIDSARYELSLDGLMTYQIPEDPNAPFLYILIT